MICSRIENNLWVYDRGSPYMRIRSRSLIIAASQAVKQVGTILLGVLLVRIIEPDEFGTYRQGMLVYGSVMGVVAVDLAASLFYFIPKSGSSGRADIVAQTVFGTFGLALLISLVMLLGAGPIAQAFNNPGLTPIIRILSLYPFVERVSVLAPCFMIAVDRPVRAGVYSLLSSLSWLGSVVIAFALGLSIPLVLGIAMAAMGLVSVISLIDTVHMAGGWRWKLDYALIWEQFHYAWPLWVTATVAVVNVEIGKIIISSMFTPGEFAVYSCGAVELPVISLVTGSLSTAILPNMVNLSAEGRVTAAMDIWHEATRKCSLLIFPCFAFFLWGSHDLIVLLYGASYALAAYPFLIYLLRLPLRAAVYGSVLRAFGKTRPIAVATVISLVVNVLVSIALAWLGKGTMLSFVGPSIGAVAASFVGVSYYVWRIGKVTGLPIAQVMRWAELGRVMAISLAATAVIPVARQAVPLSSHLVRFCVEGMLYVTALSGLILATGLLNSDERNIFRSLLRRAGRLCGITSVGAAG